jgi:outer membrane protein assembly factor BamB
MLLTVVKPLILIEVRNKGFFSGMILICIILTAFVNSDNSEQNGWRGVNRDGKVNGFTLPASWPDELKQVWKVNVGLGDASPVLVGNMLYLHTKKDSSEVTICINATSGEKVWETISNKAPVVTGGAASHPGPRSTPFVADGKIITIGAGGYVACRSASNGKLIWKSEEFAVEVPQFFVAVSPLLVENKVIAHLNGKEKGTVVAFDINDGSVIWKLEGEPSTYSSPVKMTTIKNMIIVQGEKNLFGVSADKGELLWKTPTPGESRFYNSSTPIVTGNQVIIGGQGSGTRDFTITSDGGNYLVAEKWKNPEISVSFNTPVLKDGFLYGNEARFGYVFCLNAETGAKCWTDTVKNNRFASVLDLGKVLISLPATGLLIVFKPDSSKYAEIARYKVADTEVYAHPVVTGNKIYVKEKELLTCWEIQ